jgi:hypothetical protein
MAFSDPNGPSFSRGPRLRAMAERAMIDAHYVMASRRDEAVGAPQAPELNGPPPVKGLVTGTVAGKYWLDAAGQRID